MQFDLFYDYLCPYVYQATVLLRRAGELDGDVQARWRYFSLAQVNNKTEGWSIWTAPEGDKAARGRQAFRAAEAARRQGRFDAMHWELLRARHERRLDTDDPAVVEQVAAEAGLDLERLRADVADPAILDTLARDHREAVDQGVFGTPTFVFPGGGAAYVRVMPAPEGEAARELLDRLVWLVRDQAAVIEVKRPKPPDRH